MVILLGSLHLPSCTDVSSSPVMMAHKVPEVASLEGGHQEIGPLGQADETPLAPNPAVSRRGRVQFGRTK
jgi:hypothetical protein